MISRSPNSALNTLCPVASTFPLTERLVTKMVIKASELGMAASLNLGDYKFTQLPIISLYNYYYYTTNKVLTYIKFYYNNTGCLVLNTQ